jgi:hypothetical protein
MLTPKNATYYLFYALHWIAGGLVALLTFISAQKPESYRSVEAALGLIGWSQSHKGLIFAFALTAVVSKVVCDRIGPPWVWKAIKDMVNLWQTWVVEEQKRLEEEEQRTLVQTALKEGKAAPPPKASISYSDQHRVTVFKKVPWWFSRGDWFKLKRLSGKFPAYRDWPIGWFKPIARSGNVNQRNISWFPCYDVETSGEGVIGRIWRAKNTFRLENLPDLQPTNGSTAAEEDWDNYAKAAKVPKDWLKAHGNRLLGRSFYGTRLEKKAGTPWGVIIIDSKETAVPISDPQVRFAAGALGKLLERA